MEGNILEDNVFRWAETSGSRVNDPQTSKDAAKEISQSLSVLESQFLEALASLGMATSNEVAAKIAGDNFARRNTIRRRASDLVAKQMVESDGTRVCSVTGKRATIYKIRNQQ